MEENKKTDGRHEPQKTAPCQRKVAQAMKKALIVSALAIGVLSTPLWLMKFVMMPMGIESLSVVIDPVMTRVLFFISLIASIALVYIAMRGSRKVVINLDDLGSFNINHALRLMKEQNGTIVQVGANFSGQQLFLAVYVYGEKKVFAMKEFVESIQDLEKEGDKSLVRKELDISRVYGIERLVSKKWILIRLFRTRDEMLGFGDPGDGERLVEIISVPIEPSI